MNLLRTAGLLAAAVWPARRLVGGAWWRLPGLLKPSPGALRDPGVLREHVVLQLAVAVKGSAWLLNQDAAERRSLGDGLAQYEFPEWPEPFWVDVHGDGGAEGGWGTPPRDFAVRLRFADAQQARGAMAKELDVLAELGAGRLRVDGRLPLADGLDGVMNRVERLLNAS